MFSVFGFRFSFFFLFENIFRFWSMFHIGSPIIQKRIWISHTCGTYQTHFFFPPKEFISRLRRWAIRETLWVEENSKWGSGGYRLGRLRSKARWAFLQNLICIYNVELCRWLDTWYQSFANYEHNCVEHVAVRICAFSHKQEKSQCRSFHVTTLHTSSNLGMVPYRWAKPWKQ